MLDGSDQDRLGQAHQAITNSYVVEQMEERTGSSGYYPFSLYRDSSTYGWMCNDGAPESPADIIGHFHVPGAFANRPSLKIRGTNSYASCFIKDPTSARVYSDNDIRACIGADRVVVCAVIYNQPYEVYWSDMIAWW